MNHPAGRINPSTGQCNGTRPADVLSTPGENRQFGEEDGGLRGVICGLIRHQMNGGIVEFEGPEDNIGLAGLRLKVWGKILAKTGVPP